MDLATGRKTSEELKDLLLQCIVTAYDPIYDAEVCAVKVYGAQDFARGCVYADVMSIDEKGEAVVDFERIHDVLPQKIKIFHSVKTPGAVPKWAGQQGCLRLSSAVVVHVTGARTRRSQLWVH